MGWDLYPRTVAGRVRTAEQVLREDVVPRALATYVNQRSGHAYAAVRGDGGEVQAWYFYVETGEGSDGEPWIAFKVIPTEESPRRWPEAVASKITRWF
ncbi:hypothetical protein [Leifsonia shinshuensis]